MYCPIMYRR